MSWFRTQTWSWSCSFLLLAPKGSTLRRLSESPPKGNVKGTSTSSPSPSPSPTGRCLWWALSIFVQILALSCLLMMIEQRRAPCCISYLVNAGADEADEADEWVDPGPWAVRDYCDSRASLATAQLSPALSFVQIKLSACRLD